MSKHLDQEFAVFILREIWGGGGGFRIGFDPNHALVLARRNTPSAQQHPDVVEQYLTKEIIAGRITGPFSSLSHPGYPDQLDGSDSQGPPAKQVVVDY